MESFTLVIFGITGNLSQIKLLPALYDMEDAGLLPPQTMIIGSGRSPKTKLEIEEFVENSLKSSKRGENLNSVIVKRLTRRVYYLAGQLDEEKFYLKLKQLLTKNAKERHNCIFYLATYPSLYQAIFKNLSKSGLNRQGSGFVRLMIEKPLGNDLSSARELNRLLARYFSASQVYRLDHYLGKETMQNILSFRFGNGLLDTLMTSQFIDHIQICASETIGVGNRVGFYDQVGALKDVGQNHILQMLASVCMDAPKKFNNTQVTSSRIKIFKNLKSEAKGLVFGQYHSYLQETGVAPNSTTETFFAFKTEVLIPRLMGVPIYVRAGKKLAKNMTTISVVFKNSFNQLFKETSALDSNVLVFRIQPEEGVGLRLLTKRPGVGLEMEGKYMNFDYKTSQLKLVDPYHRLMFDAMHGDQTFFNDAEEVEAQWKFIDDLALDHKTPILYPDLSWGPDEAVKLIEQDNRKWLND